MLDDTWQKSSFSAGQGACVEATVFTDGKVGVRHSVNQVEPILYTPQEWAAFMAGVKAGEFDLPV